LRYLERAAQHYNRALSENPKEDYFSQPFNGSFLAQLGKSSLNSLRSVMGGRKEEVTKRAAPAPLQRVQAALTKYRTIMSQEEVLEGGGPVAGAKELEGSGGEIAAGEKALKNSDIIDLVKAGLAQEIILTAIDDAESCSFDLSPTGLIGLSNSKVNTEIIKRMQTARCASY
jgi:hypothetical protein